MAVTTSKIGDTFDISVVCCKIAVFTLKQLSHKQAWLTYLFGSNKFFRFFSVACKKLEQYLSERENLQALIEAEWKKYKQAIIEDKPFEEVKIVYLHTKKLQLEIIELTDKIHKSLKMGN